MSALHSAFSCRKRVPFPKPRNAFSLLLNSSSALLMSPANLTFIWRFSPIQVVTNCSKLPDVTRIQPKIHPYGKDEPLNSEASSPISFSVLSRQRPHRGVSWTAREGRASEGKTEPQSGVRGGQAATAMAKPSTRGQITEMNTFLVCMESKMKKKKKRRKRITSAWLSLS